MKSENNYTETYNYEFDKNGYVSKITILDEDNEIDETNTLQHKKSK